MSWNEPTEDQKKLVALMAKYEALEKANKKQPPGKPKGSPRKEAPKGKGKAKAPPKTNSDKSNKIPDWKLIPSKDGKTELSRDDNTTRGCGSYISQTNVNERTKRRKAHLRKVVMVT